MRVPEWNEELTRCLLPGAIVYTQPTNCGGGRAARSPDDRPCESDAPCIRLFHPLDSPLHQPIILLTGQSDWATRDFCGLALNPDNGESHPLLIHWFGQNGNVRPSPHFSPLPIGINCFEMATQLRSTLIHRYADWRAAQCGLSAFTTNDSAAYSVAVERWLWQLDGDKRRSFDPERVGVLHTLLHFSRHQPSSEVLAMNQRINRHSERQGRSQSEEEYALIAATMAERNRVAAAAAPPPDAPLLPCSALVLPGAGPELLASSPASNGNGERSPPAPSYAANVVNAHRVRDGQGGGKLAVANFGMTHSRREQVLRALCEPATAPNNSDWLSCIQHSWADVELTSHYGRLTDFLYWLSPRGNGLESHRTWEALYLGCVPVLERSEITEGLFEDGDLPVLLVDDLTQLSKATLLAHLPRFEWIDRDFGRRKLQVDFWKKVVVDKQREWRENRKFIDTANFSREQLHEMEHHRCWGSSHAFNETW